MTLTGEIRALLQRDGGEGVYWLKRNEYMTIYQWIRREKKKGKNAGIMGLRNGEDYYIWHEDYRRGEQ